MALKKNPKYDLKLHYKRILETSLAITLALLIAAFKFFPKYEGELVKAEAAQELLQVEDVVKTKQESAPPPPPKPPIPIEAPTDEVIEDIEFASTELDMTEQVESTPPPPPDAGTSDEGEPVFFIAVEEQPEPIGGIASIQSKIIYPDFARRAGVEGRVIVKAFVDEGGNVVKVEVQKGIGAGCDEAAMDAVRQTKFKPGKQRGKAVKVQVSVPVIFKLQ